MASDQPQPQPQPQPSTSASLSPMSSSIFSFTAPFPPRPTLPSSSSPSSSPSSAKQRRVSLPSSPRFSPIPTWSFRDEMGLEAISTASSATAVDKHHKPHKIEPTSVDLPNKDTIPPVVEKKPRKKWTEEETQMLVEGCNKWGVGNWKVILNDPELTFDSRSPVDLKDRFRTFFPDAYKQHYPNAKTHLSSKIRASLPDGSSIFEKTRSKKRRPFTPEEDEALKRGYDKHGTLWASILKDPIFQAKNRRSTDLRDRFRNAFPDLYEAAGYKPRNNSKKKKLSEGTLTGVETLQEPPKVGPRRKRASTAPAARSIRSRRGIRSATCSDSEESSGDEELRGRHSGSSLSLETRGHTEVTPQPQELAESADKTPADSTMASCTDSSGSLSLSEAAPEPSTQTWSQWATTTTTSPTRRPTSDIFLSSQTESPTSLTFNRRGSEHTAIGNSAWATEDWLSPNPRLEASLPDSSSSSFIGGPSPVPSSPFSFSMSTSASAHGVMDRYDLFPAAFSASHHNLHHHHLLHHHNLHGNNHHHDYADTAASEVGLNDRDTHSAFSEADLFNPATASYRGFTHHSNSAGDLIFAVGRSQQPLHIGGTGGSLGLHDMRSSEQGSLEARRMGIGISHSGLPGIDEIPLSAISLHDRGGPGSSVAGAGTGATDADMDDSEIVQSSRGASSPPDRHHTANDEEMPPDLDFSLPSATAVSPNPLESEEILVSTPTSLTNPISPIDLDLPQHQRPSPTPLGGVDVSVGANGISKARPRSMHSMQHLGSTSSFRSFSQPPTEHRSHTGPPPLHAHTRSSPLLFSSTQSQTHSNLRSQTATLDATFPSDALWRGPNDLTDLPFLDLHYYKSNTLPGGAAGLNTLGAALFQDAVVVESAHAQALDLAGWGMGMSSTPMNGSLSVPGGLHQQPISIAPSLLHTMSPTVEASGPESSAQRPTGMEHSLSETQLQLQGPTVHLQHAHSRLTSSTSTLATSSSSTAAGSRIVTRPTAHHRVQSAVSPDDLILKKGPGDTNKRKRASWDGGAAS